jgi:hypothetical protein
MCHRVFQVLSDGMNYLIEGILRRGIDVQMQVVGCQPYDMDSGLCKGQCGLSDQVSNLLTMLTGK